ncbi:MAG TPA: ATPase domain-containing protein [Nitrososphaerales archaeon]|nr:ATPase domain-containing protein [Nitrososphaerales archaeon]
MQVSIINLSKPEFRGNDFEFVHHVVSKITTGSSNFDSLLGGGLPVSCLTDVFGAAGTGKTQFCFQNAVTTCKYFEDRDEKGIKVVFVDCTGSFRPERIVEIAESRLLDPEPVLRAIFSINVRSAAAQIEVSRRFDEDPSFAGCKLMIVDDLTSNFISDYSKESELPARQRALSLYGRRLSYLANRRGLSVLVSNSIRSRGNLGEGETTGEVLSAYALYRLYFNRADRRRYMEIVQPNLSGEKIEFEIGKTGLS